MLANSARGGHARARYCNFVSRMPNLRPLRALLTIACAALLGFAASNAGWSQSREVLLGTITAGQATAGREHARAAAELLVDGLAALERGDVMLGRRRLEALVDRYPDSAAATAARDELGMLYSSQRSQGFLAARDAGALQLRRETREPERAPAQPESRSIGSTGGRATEREAVLARQRIVEDDRRAQVLALDFQTSAGDRVFFAESSTELGAKARSVLAAQARWLAKHTNLPVTVEAHADDHGGNRELDVRLAEKRGEAVRERLLEEGVAASRITVQAFGRDRPVATCSAPECAVQNRRVVTRVASTAAADNAVRRGPDAPAYATAPRRSLGSRTD